MIDLRYHIVSLMAVFLALALGILLGSSVVSTPLEARLQGDLARARDARASAQDRATELEEELEALRRRLSGEVGPWSVHGRLQGRDLIVVSDGSQIPAWRNDVRDVLLNAGSEPAGTITLEDRWRLATPEEADELVRTVQGVVPSFDQESGVSEAALTLLGERLLEPTGRALLDELVGAGFVSVQARPDGAWPRPGSVVVLLSASRTGSATPLPGAALFARSVAQLVPTLVVSDSPDGRSVVTQLRRAEDLPDALATFDAGTADGDPGGIGVTAALVAATQGRGGHYGSEEGRPFIAPAAPEA